MIFKDDDETLKHEYAQTPAMLQVMCEWFRSLCVAHFTKDPVITRVFEHICGDSGVHEQKRAVDFRDQHDSHYFFTPEESRFLVSEMNRRFPRSDNKPTLLHHSFAGGPFHHHLQVHPGVTEDASEAKEP